MRTDLTQEEVKAAKIGVNSKLKNLGYFKEFEDAVRREGRQKSNTTITKIMAERHRRTLCPKY